MTEGRLKLANVALPFRRRRLQETGPLPLPGTRAHRHRPVRRAHPAAARLVHPVHAVGDPGHPVLKGAPAR